MGQYNTRETIRESSPAINLVFSRAWEIFYEKCGFVRSHNIPNFFTDNYDHPIYECGVQLIDMVYLQRCSEENKLMNILVLNGSPHVNANTMAMVNAFADGAREKNHDIQTVQVMKITINSF